MADGLRGLKVLVAADGRFQRTVVASMLTEQGAEIALAESADDSLDAADAARTVGREFDLVLVGRSLTDGPGTGYPAQLRARGLAVPCVLIGGDDDRDDAAENGFAACVPEPLLTPSLVATVGQVVGRGEVEPGWNLDEPGVQELLVRYRESLGCLAHAFRDALAGRDRDGLQVLASRLRAAAPSYGFHALGHAAEAVDRAALAAAPLPALADRVHELLAQITAVRAELPKKRSQSSAVEITASV